MKVRQHLSQSAKDFSMKCKGTSNEVPNTDKLSFPGRLVSVLLGNNKIFLGKIIVSLIW